MAVLRITVVAIVVSELITFVLIRILLDQILVEGQIIAFVCAAPISAWISDRQLRMRRIISRQRDHLAELNVELGMRNAELDAFSRGVAHDLKNPLTTVIGLTQVLSDDPSVRAADRENILPSVLQSGEQAVEIINGLLLLHGLRNEDPDLGPVASDEVVHDVLRTLAKPISDTRATVIQSGAFPPVEGYGPWLQQIWENLINNALKYGGSPPTVHLSSRRLADGNIRFEVRDHGAGIAVQDRERIFDEFERSGTTEADGHGLGLAIVRRIVSRLGGDVGLENPPGGGALFWFVLPAAS